MITESGQILVGYIGLSRQIAMVDGGPAGDPIESVDSRTASVGCVAR